MRRSEIDNILGTITPEQVPDYVKSAVQDEMKAYKKKEFTDKNTEVFITSPHLFLDFIGAGPGINNVGNFDIRSVSAFKQDSKKCFSYLLNNKTTLENFMKEIETQTNLERFTYQIYKYYHKTQNWVPFLQAANVNKMKSKKVFDLLRRDMNKILLIVPLDPAQEVFHPMKEGSMDEERPHSDMLRANTLTWFVNDKTTV